MAPAPTPTPTGTAAPADRRRIRRGGPPRTAALATVWSHDPADPQATLAALITTYTRPGHRVVLLTPPGPTWLDAGTDWTAHLTGPGPALARLRRRLQVRTDRPDHRPPTGPAREDRRPTSESGPGPASPTGAADPLSRTSTGAHPAGGTATATSPGRHTSQRPVGRDGAREDRADLLVTAVDPHAPDWVAHLPWTALLTRSGLLAAITHSDRRRGRWVDPLPALAAALTSAGLVWHDRIVLHHQPRVVGRAELGPAVGHERIHTDVLLFGQQRLTRAGGWGGRDA